MLPKAATPEIVKLAAVSKAQKTQVITKFFESFNSPLKEHAESFVDTADKYGLDYRLLPAISCMESSCGKFLIPETHNPFGWGIYGSRVTYFDTYGDAIDTVGKGLSEHYVKKGLDTVEKIAPVYTPPRYVHWRTGVNYFISKINTIESKSELTI